MSILVDFLQFRVTTRLFFIELITWKRENFKTLSLPTFVELLQISKLAGEAALAGCIYDQDNFPSILG
jgi:hypothetical protein